MHVHFKRLCIPVLIKQQFLLGQIFAAISRNGLNAGNLYGMPTKALHIVSNVLQIKYLLY